MPTYTGRKRLPVTLSLPQSAVTVITRCSLILLPRYLLDRPLSLRILMFYVIFWNLDRLAPPILLILAIPLLRSPWIAKCSSGGLIGIQQMVYSPHVCNVTSYFTNHLLPFCVSFLSRRSKELFFRVRQGK